MAADRKSRTVLLIDDNDDYRLEVAHELTELGYRVIQCPNAMGAAGWLASGNRPDLMISDVFVPGDAVLIMRQVVSMGIPAIALSDANRTARRTLMLKGVMGVDVYPSQDLGSLLMQVQRILPSTMSTEDPEFEVI